MSPHGVVADYAPFYYAARSPMMYVIDRGGVPTYTRGCDDLVYLVTTVERLAELGALLVLTDRNALLGMAEFTNDPDGLDELIDWSLMRATMWSNTSDQPDRKERRMAECLVHERTPWEAFTEIVAKNSACARQAQATVATVGRGVPVVPSLVIEPCEGIDDALVEVGRRSLTSLLLIADASTVREEPQ